MVEFISATYNDVMIDIETMSLHRHKALILSVGLIEFNPSLTAGLTIGDRALLVPSISEQLLLKRHVDQGTQKFWAEQPLAASMHWRKSSRDPCQTVIDAIRKFCVGKERVWANGTQFDLSNLDGLAEDLKDPKELWHYQAPRDMRTFCRETVATRLVPIGDAFDIPGVAHEPIYDCEVQAWQIWAHYQEK